VPFQRAKSDDGRIRDAGTAVLFVTDGRSASQRVTSCQCHGVSPGT